MNGTEANAVGGMVQDRVEVSAVILVILQVFTTEFTKVRQCRRAVDGHDLHSHELAHVDSRELLVHVGPVGRVFDEDDLLLALVDK